jgi:hypothetical protein
VWWCRVTNWRGSARLFAALFPPAGVVICAMLGATHPWRAFGTILSAAGWLALYETLLLRHFA